MNVALKVLSCGFLAAVTVAGTYYICETYRPHKKPTVVAAVAPVVEEISPTKEEALDAVMRTFVRAKKLCINHGDKVNYFGFWPTDPKDPTNLNGWYYFDDVPLYHTETGKWFTQDIPNEKFIKVYPDVTGLTCIER